MIEESQLRRRFLEDDVPHRMGNLSSTLSRLSDTMIFNRPTESVLAVLDDGQRFVRWTLGDVTDSARLELDRLSLDLKYWRGSWPSVVGEPGEVAKLAGEAKAWSDRVLELSGLLTREC
jgi:hypothetical protein